MNLTRMIGAWRWGIMFLFWSRNDMAITYSSPLHGRITAGSLHAGRNAVAQIGEGQ